MKLYNTLTRQKEEFVPITPGEVKMYSCGPTVYNYFHVGNARPFIIFDLLRRYFEYRGYKVEFVQNFTDIDDKVINKANEEGVDFNTIAERYIKEYFVDAQGLGVKKATVHPRATETMDAIIDVMRFWLGLGCDGFRVDMAASLVKNDPDSLGTIALWQKVRAFLDAEFPEAAMVSEWGEPEKSLRGGFHMDFLLHFGPSHYNDLFRCEEPYFSDRGVGDASAFVEKYLESRERAGKDGLICIPSGNHDMTRLAKHVEGDEKKLAFAFLLTMPGAPFIYYGDEIGMRYVEGLTSVEGGYERTGARSPMQWDNGVNAGFSAAPTDKIYIRQDPASDRPTVAGQLDDEASLLNHVRRLSELRQAHSALQSRSGITFVSDGTPKRPLVYKRGNDEETLLVAINPYREEVSFRLDGTLGGALYTFGGEAAQKGETVTLPPVSAGVYGLK